MFGGSWRLGRLFGIEVRIDSSWLVIAVLVIYTLYNAYDFQFPRTATPALVVLAVVFGLLFFGSVLAHEMAHAVMARRRGIEVKGITLFLFGGATHAKVDSRGPQDELIVSIVGPLTSALLGGVFILVEQALGGTTTPVAWGFLYLGAVNFLLAVFNMLPGFPLDGGRILRALVWRTTGNFARATRVASIAGQVVGLLIVTAGVVLLTFGDVGRAIWFAAIGWFLAQAARSSGREVLRRRQNTGSEESEVSEPKPSQHDSV
ncbi:MAG: site-2 protease family protein [Actinomycetota bacterium]